MEGEVVNFFVHYEIDDNTSRHVLKLDDYGGDGVDSCGCCWRRSRRWCGVWSLGAGSFLSPWQGSRRVRFLNMKTS